MKKEGCKKKVKKLELIYVTKKIEVIFMMIQNNKKTFLKLVNNFLSKYSALTVYQT